MSPPLPPAPRSRLSPVLVAGLLCVYFTAWALLRPPLQSPDEPQHLLRATSVLRQPWVGAPDRFPLDPGRVNPLALETPAGLDKLFFSPFNAMTAADLASARAAPWLDAGRPLPDYERAIASYPTPYYLAVFGLAEPVVRVAALTPYQATYAYRLASSALAAALWALVWAVLARTPGLGGAAAPVFVLTLLNPMLAFMSSAVNPDAVNNPLCALGLLLVWRVAAEARGSVPAAGALLAAMLTKPSGLQLAPALGLALGLLAAGRRLDGRRAAAAGASIAGAALAAVLAFYAWSPPRFMAGGPSPDGLRQYLAARWDQLGLAWRSYWGQPGWLDYHAGEGWYWLVAAAVAVNLAALAVRPAAWPGLARFFALSWTAFVAVTFAGEFWYLPLAGYTFQGRYLFPVALAATGAMLAHRVRPAQHALLAALAGLHAALVHETVVRYYADGWTGLVQSLPFWR